MVPTLLLYAAPRRVLAPERDWSGFHPQGFSKEFEWTQDRLGGLLDTVTPVEQTLTTQQGDCEDYAAVVASYLLAETDKDVRLGYLWSGLPVTDAHSVVYTSERVYSSGYIYSKSFTDYKQATPYTHAVTRSV